MADTAPPAENGATPPRGRSFRLALRAIVALAALAVTVLGGGLIWFLFHVPGKEVALDRNADGIVVLTGGASRISDAIELLAERQLPASGCSLAVFTVAHRSAEIARIVPLLRGLRVVLRRPRPLGHQHGRQCG